MNVLSKNYLFTFLYKFIGVTSDNEIIRISTVQFNDTPRVCCIAFANALLHALGEHGHAMP